MCSDYKHGSVFQSTLAWLIRVTDSLHEWGSSRKKGECAIMQSVHTCTCIHIIIENFEKYRKCYYCSKA